MLRLVACLTLLLIAGCGRTHTSEPDASSADSASDGRTDGSEPADSGPLLDAPGDEAGSPSDAGSDGSAACGDCEDANPCTIGRCVEGGCVQVPNDGASCDDGVFCNGADTCSGGRCSEHAGDPCGGECGGCDPERDACTGGGCASDDDCPSPIEGDWSPCESDDPCATEGQQTREVTELSCETCTCEPSVHTETRTCDRDPDPDC